MTNKLSQSTASLLGVFELIADGDLQGSTLTEVTRKIGRPKTTVHRILNNLVEAGWLVSVKPNNSKVVYWRISDRLLRVAHSHRRKVKQQLDEMKDHYQDITGEDLDHE